MKSSPQSSPTKISRQSKPAPVQRTGFHPDQFCRHYRLKRAGVTRLTGYSPRTLDNWASGKSPSDSAQRKLAETTRLFNALEGIMRPASIGPWLMAPNPAFEGSTPLQVIERGESDRIWRMLYEIETGALQ